MCQTKTWFVILSRVTLMYAFNSLVFEALENRGQRSQSMAQPRSQSARTRYYGSGATPPDSGDEWRAFTPGIFRLRFCTAGGSGRASSIFVIGACSLGFGEAHVSAALLLLLRAFSQK